MESALSSDVFVFWAVAVPVAYCLVNGILRWGNWLPATKRGTAGADVMAYEVVSGVICVYIGFFGTISWLNLCPDRGDFESIEADRWYGRSEFFERHLCIPLLVYQFYNLVICLIIAEMRHPLMLVHHTASLLCALFSLYPKPIFQYYGLFFYGIPEVSSIPLAFISVTKSFPFIKKDYPNMFAVNKLVFGVLFLLVRIVLWTGVVISFWTDICQVFFSVSPQQQGGGGSSSSAAQEVHSVGIVAYYCSANILVTGMQYYWGFIIAQQLLAGGGGGEKNKKKVE
jgi:hypothetical protein